MATIIVEIDIDASGNLTVTPNPAVVGDGDTVRWHVNSNAHGGGALNVSLPPGANCPFRNRDNELRDSVEIPRHCNPLEPATKPMKWPSGVNSYAYNIEFSGSPVISAVRGTLVKREALNIPDDFWQWLKQSRKSLGIFIVTAIPIIVALVINYRFNVFDLINWKITVHGFQAVVITVLLLMMREPLPDDKTAVQASIAIDQFYTAWKRLWFFWLLLYAGLALQELWSIFIREHLGIMPGPDGSINSDDQMRLKEYLEKSRLWSLGVIATNVLNNLQTLTLFMCYLVVSKKTVPRKQEVNSEGTVQPEQSKASLPWLKPVAVLICITLLEILFTFAGKAFWEESFVDAPEIFTWLSGLGAGVVMALLIGRLDSKLIGLPIWVVISIYLYAVIQAGWAAFPEDPEVKIILVIAALGLKILLFLLVTWLLKSGVFLYYLKQIGKVEEASQHQRREFLQKFQATTQDDVTN